MSCVQILLDGPGDLKYSDFGLSRIKGENMEELFEQFSGAGLEGRYFCTCGDVVNAMFVCASDLSMHVYACSLLFLLLKVDAHHIKSFVTSANEVMFFPLCVCLLAG